MRDNHDAVGGGPVVSVVDNSVKPHQRDAAADELRRLLDNPRRSSIKPNELGRRLGWTPQQAGSVLADLGRDTPADLSLSARPGGRGGQRWEVTRA